MANESGLRVTVQGGLPQEAMERIASSVRRAVLQEVAELDLAPPLRELPDGGPTGTGERRETSLVELRNWVIPLGLILESGLPQ
jgi:hypothetical protein